MAQFIDREYIDQLSAQLTEFDFSGAMNELLDIQDEAGCDKCNATIESAIQVVLDHCYFD